MNYLWNVDRAELAEQLQEPDNYIVAGRNGLYDVRIAETGTFVAKAKRPILHLCEMKEGFIFNLPRIPYKILLNGITLFYSFRKKGVEARYQIFWDRDTFNYFGHIPKFTSTATHISTERSWELEQKHLLVVDLHSHLADIASFSSVDDANEMESGIIYGVVAVGRSMPDIVMRFSCGGNYVQIDPAKVLELPHEGAVLLEP